MTIHIEFKCKTSADLMSVSDFQKQASNYEFRILRQGLSGMMAWFEVAGREHLVRDAIGTIPALGALPVSIAEVGARRFAINQRVVFKTEGSADSFMRSWEVYQYQDDGRITLAGPGCLESLRYATEDELTEYIGAMP